MAKYCIFISAPRYGSRDEIIGSMHHREACATSKRAAEKLYRAAQRKHADDDELHVTLCRGERMCRGWDKNSMKRRRKKKPSTSRSRRRQRRNDLPF